MTFLLPLLTVQLVIATAEVQLQEVDLTPTLFASICLTQPTESEEVEDVAITTWGKEGTWRWGIHGGYAEDLSQNENKLSLLGVEFDYFIAVDRVADGPSDIYVIERRSLGVKTKTYGPPVEITVRRLAFVVSRDLWILSNDCFIVRNRE